VSAMDPWIAMLSGIATGLVIAILYHLPRHDRRVLMLGIILMAIPMFGMVWVSFHYQGQ
jgi:hypothetical protein